MRRKLKVYKGFTIYEDKEAIENAELYRFSCYLPDQGPRLDTPEWEADNLQEIHDFIDTY